MKHPRSVARWLLAAACLDAAPARAHDTTTSWTIVQLRPTSIELTTKIAAESVWPAVQAEAPEATFAMEQLEALRPLLVRCAQRLHVLRVDDKPLEAQGGEVRVVEDYLEFRVVYPRPKGGHGQLRAAYLGRMSPEFVADVSVIDDQGAALADEQLTAAQPVLEFGLPEAPAPEPKAPSPRGKR